MDDGDSRDEPEPRPESAVDSVLLEYVRDPALWPVLAVLVLVAATLGACVLLLAIVDRNLFAMAALALLVGMSAHAVGRNLRRWRSGVAPRVV
ncbi:MAG: hypothetical protein QF462_15205, partial [Myxococcota bacterium]|nr:hypothetical protein [Myxococcota bacterium]